jgi:hypothetical protein
LMWWSLPFIRYRYRAGDVPIGCPLEVWPAPALRAAWSADVLAAGATPSELAPLFCDDPVVSDGDGLVVDVEPPAAPALRSACAALGLFWVPVPELLCPLLV